MYTDAPLRRQSACATPGTPQSFSFDPPKIARTSSSSGINGASGGGGDEIDQIRLLLDYLEEHVQPSAGKKVEEDSGSGQDVTLSTLKQYWEGSDLLDLESEEEESFPPSSKSGRLSWDSVLSHCCVTVRRMASVASLLKLVGSCDIFIRNNLNDLLTKHEILSLPRLQVNVNVKGEDAREIWTAGDAVLNRIITSVVSQLQEAAFQWSELALGEKVVEVILQSDLTVILQQNSKNSVKYLSPAKPMADYISLAKKQPSPARKLQLGVGLNLDDDDNQGSSNTAVLPKDWSVVASTNISSTTSVCVVHVNRDLGLLVLNVQLVSKDSPKSMCPISPTTGIPLSTAGGLLSQMATSRSGFGLVAADDSFMSIGGFNRDGVLSEVERYNRKWNAWTPSGRLVTKRARMGVAKGKDSIFVIGGSDGKFELSSVEEFKLEEGNSQWKQLDAKLHCARTDFGAAVLGDKLYAVGGTSYSRLLKSVEVFDTKEQKWSSISPLQIPRKGLAVVACNGKIFAIGGQQCSWNCLGNVECYDPSTNKWTEVASLTSPRRNASAIVVEDRIYVVGGYNGSKAVGTVEMYDPVQNAWSKVESMAVCRSGASSVALDGTIFVVGGFTGRCFLNSMEAYSMDSEQWSSMSHESS